MKIKWWGHSCFTLTFSGGQKVLTDPFEQGVGYTLPAEPVDIVTVSHQHFDHNAAGEVKGSPQIIEDLGVHRVAGLKIIGYASYHDQKHGKLRGPNTIYVIEGDGLKVCHLGDLGHKLDEDVIASLGDIHVLLIPVGGIYTIGAREASEIARAISPPLVIPMHYQTPDLKLEIGPVDEFTRRFSVVKKLDILEVDAEHLPSTMTVVELSYK